MLRAFGEDPVSTHTVRSVGEDDPSERWLLAAGALAAGDVSKHADTGAVVDGSQSVRWLSTAAMRADVAASRVFAAGVEGFEAVPPDRRIGLFRNLRLFI